MIFPALHIAVSISCPAAKAYAYTSNPENLPAWASGLGAVEQIDGDWVAEMESGRVKIVFAKKNEFGILDHNVTLPSGENFYNPMRVFRNGEGCEIVFTLFRLPGISDVDYAKDAATIERDLQTLKVVLER
jgi:hypothetical protein